MTAMDALMVRLAALGYFVCRLFTLPKLVKEEVAAPVVDNEGDNARMRAESDELRERVDNLQAIPDSYEKMFVEIRKSAPGGSSPVDTKPLSKPT